MAQAATASGTGLASLQPAVLNLLHRHAETATEMPLPPQVMIAMVPYWAEEAANAIGASGFYRDPECDARLHFEIISALVGHGWRFICDMVSGPSPTYSLMHAGAYYILRGYIVSGAPGSSPPMRSDARAITNLRLLKLPPELRNRIYKLVLQFPVSGVHIKLKHSLRFPPGGRGDVKFNSIVTTITRNPDEEIGIDQWSFLNAWHEPNWELPLPLKAGTLESILSLLCVNKQIRIEDEHMFYSFNRFHFGNIVNLHALISMLNSTASDRVKLIRSVSFEWLPTHHLDSGCMAILKVLKLETLGIWLNQDRWKAGDGMEVRFPSLKTLCSVTGLKVLYFEGNCEDVARHVRQSTDAEKVKYHGIEVRKA